MGIHGRNYCCCDCFSQSIAESRVVCVFIQILVRSPKNIAGHFSLIQMAVPTTGEIAFTLIMHRA
jgi:hypothetical protein